MKLPGQCLSVQVDLVILTTSVVELWLDACHRLWPELDPGSNLNHCGSNCLCGKSQLYSEAKVAM